MRTADVTPSGALDINLSGIFDNYKIPGSSNHDYDATVQMGFTYGLWNFFEMSAVVPYLAASRSSITGWRNVQTTAKIRLLGSREKGYGVAVTGFTDVDTSSSAKNLNSGKPAYGGEMNISIFGEVASFHLNAGWQKSDTKFVTSTGVNYLSERRITGAAGLEIRALPELIFSVEALGERTTKRKDKNLLIVPGIRYSLNDYVSFNLGAAIGIPTDSSIPENQYLAGVTFEFGNPGKVHVISTRMNESEARQQAMEENIQKLEKDIDARLNNFEVALKGATEHGAAHTTGVSTTDQAKMKEELLQLEGRVSALEKSTGPAPVPSSRSVPNKWGEKKPRIEIVNGTRYPGLAEKITHRLKNRGYNIVRTRDDASLHQKYSTIYYREGYAERAVTTGHMIPKDQYVFRKPDIDPDIDIQVVIGSDLGDLR